MGVPGLWDILRPSGQTRSLTELAVVEGFEANKSGLRGFRIGIDASIWFFHAEYGKEGENPELRTLFFRCATLMHAPFLPLFVFDGPKRPDFKRGKRISKSNNALVNGMKAIIEAFGYEWRMAPAEAEAELAYLNRIGLIDGILSDDVDNFLFGALTVIRNQSNTLSGNRSNPVLNAEGKDDKQHTKVYRLQDIQSHEDIGLTRGGMILIGLMRGGDYHQEGVVGCGPVIAHGLARCGFGDQLCGAVNRLSRDELPAFLDNWRHALREELRTNTRGFVGRKHTKLAASISDAFPDINVLLSYTHPITTESMGRTQNNLKLTWSRDPDLTRLARTCEQFFEWGFKESIIKRFRTIIWPGTVLRVLRRGALQQEKVLSASAALPQGSPSKIIARHFSSIKLDSDDENTELDSARQFIVKIHSTRNHVSTDGVLEYRLEIDPATFVRLAEAGIVGDRRPEDQNEWSSDEQEDEDEEGGKKKGEKKNPPDPFSHLRVWVPAAMVRLVEPDIVAKFEAAQERKLAKKAGKIKAGIKATTAGSDAENIPVPKPRKKATRSKVMPKVSKKVDMSAEEEEESGSDVALPAPLLRKAILDESYAEAATKAAPREEEESSPSNPPLPKRRSKYMVRSKSSAELVSKTLSNFEDEGECSSSSSVARRSQIFAPSARKTELTSTTKSRSLQKSSSRIVSRLDDFWGAPVISKQKGQARGTSSQASASSNLPPKAAPFPRLPHDGPSLPVRTMSAPVGLPQAPSKNAVDTPPKRKPIQLQRVLLPSEESCDDDDMFVKVHRQLGSKKARPPARPPVVKPTSAQPKYIDISDDSDAPAPSRRPGPVKVAGEPNAAKALVRSSVTDTASEGASTSHIEKSPRKSLHHTSPHKTASSHAALSRSPSPSPARPCTATILRPLVAPDKLATEPTEIIEISSDDEDFPIQPMHLPGKPVNPTDMGLKTIAKPMTQRTMKDFARVKAKAGQVKAK